MLDIGWSEMGLILLVALIVIGPKDLPRVARQVGRWTAKARAMAREFQRSIDDMAREAELQDIKAEIDKVSRTDLRSQIENTIDPDRELRRGLEPPPRPFAPDPTPAKPAVPPPEPKSEPVVSQEAAANAGEPPAIPVEPPQARTLAPATTSSEKA